MNRQILYIFLVLSFMAGCAPMQPLFRPLDYNKGYSDVQVDQNTMRVTFRGNYNTSRETVETCLLYRCAEATLEHKCSWFVIIDRNVDTLQTIVNTPTSHRTRLLYWDKGRFIYEDPTTYGVMPMVYEKYNATAVIRMFKDKIPKNPAAYDASEVIKSLSPYVKRQ